MLEDSVNRGRRLEAVVPAYVLEHDSPAALFTRLQRVVIFLEFLQREAVRDYDITFADFVLLATLRKEPEPHELLVGRIAEYVLRPTGSITHAVNRVEQRGLVRRRQGENDGREVVVSLTPTGRQFADEALASYDAIRERMFGRLSGDELDMIDRSVMLLLTALEADYRENVGA